MAVAKSTDPLTKSPSPAVDKCALACSRHSSRDAAAGRMAPRSCPKECQLKFDIDAITIALHISTDLRNAACDCVRECRQRSDTARSTDVGPRYGKDRRFRRASGARIGLPAFETAASRGAMNRSVSHPIHADMSQEAEHKVARRSPRALAKLKPILPALNDAQVVDT